MDVSLQVIWGPELFQLQAHSREGMLLLLLEAEIKSVGCLQTVWGAPRNGRQPSSQSTLLRLEKTSKVESSYQPNIDMFIAKPHPQMPHLHILLALTELTFLGSLFQCLTTLSMKNFLLKSNLNFPWQNLRTFPFISCHPVTCLLQRRDWSPPLYKLLWVVVESNKVSPEPPFFPG